MTRFVRVLAALALAAFFAPQREASLASVALRYGRTVAEDVLRRFGSPLGDREVDTIVATAADRVTVAAAGIIPLAALVLLLWPHRRRLAFSFAVLGSALSAFLPLVVGFRLNQDQTHPIWTVALLPLPFAALAIVGTLTRARRLAPAGHAIVALLAALGGLAYIFTTRTLWAPPAFAPVLLAAAAWLELPLSSEPLDEPAS